MVDLPSVPNSESLAPYVADLRDIEKIYTIGSQQTCALSGVSLQIGRGSFWAIMGPSGSGKSTMLNLMGCLDRPTRGQYLLEGQEVASLDDDSLSEFRLRYFGFIFQSFNLIPALTVVENIALPLYYLGWKQEASKHRAKTLTDRVGLADRASHRPYELSGGEQQRVAVARALANDPSILLADEPTGNLDSHTGNQIMELLSELNDTGKTVVLITHETDIAAYAQRRIHMRDGQIHCIE